MMAARSVTFLATDREVGRLGTRLVQDGAKLVVWQNRHRRTPSPSSIVLPRYAWVFRPFGQAGGQVPPDPRGD